MVGARPDRGQRAEEGVVSRTPLGARSRARSPGKWAAAHDYKEKLVMNSYRAAAHDLRKKLVSSFNYVSAHDLVKKGLVMKKLV